MGILAIGIEHPFYMTVQVLHLPAHSRAADERLTWRRENIPGRERPFRKRESPFRSEQTGEANKKAARSWLA
jgi:hypothetical protein